MSSDFEDATAIIAYHAVQLSKKPCLVVIKGKNIAHRYPLVQMKMQIGRAPDVEIVLQDEVASRHHARILSDASGTEIEDLHSTNGTYVNNQKIDRCRLQDGDLITIGDTLLKYTIQSEAESAFHDEIIDTAKTDGLTGLLNRAFFDRHFSQVLSRAEREQGEVCFILCDLDNFKRINDRYGHLVGDLVLKRVSAVIQQTIRPGDVAGRYGGEELCVLLPDTDLNSGSAVAERIRAAVAALDFSEGVVDLKVTMSIGISNNQKHNIQSVEGLTQRADEHLYQAKAQGKNQVVS